MTGTAPTAQSDEIVARLKLNGAWFAAEAELSAENLLAKISAEQGITVSDDELQQEFDHFRTAQELHKANDTHEWLKLSGLTVEQVENWLESGIRRTKLARKLVDDRQIEAYYNQNPSEFEYAQISQLVVAEAGAADELALSVREEGEDFGKLAKQHSLDQSTRLSGGFVGLITREEAGGLPGDVADRIFAASTGEVIGPFELAGEAHCLVHVEEVGHRALDDDLRAALRNRLFCERMGHLAQ